MYYILYVIFIYIYIYKILQDIHQNSNLAPVLPSSTELTMRWASPVTTWASSSDAISAAAMASLPTATPWSHGAAP